MSFSISGLFHSVTHWIHGGAEDIEAAGKTTADTFENEAGRAYGELENLGLGSAIPAKWYSSPVDGNLTRCAQPTLEQLQSLRDGPPFIKATVTLRSEDDSDVALAQQLGLNVKRIAIIDNTPPSQSQIKEFLDFVTNPDNQPAVVHCKAGKGRTGVMVAAYRMAVDGWTLDRALKEATDYGMAMPSQFQAVRVFARRLAAGEVDGYPLAVGPSVPQ